MFKRLWERLNYWAEVMDMDDPRGEYVLRLEERVTKLERDVEGLQIQSRATPVGADDPVHRLQIVNADAPEAPISRLPVKPSSKVI